MNKLWCVAMERRVSVVVLAPDRHSAERIALRHGYGWIEWSDADEDARTEHEVTNLGEVPAGFGGDETPVSDPHVKSPNKSTIRDLLTLQAEERARLAASGTHPTSPGFVATADLFPGGAS